MVLPLRAKAKIGSLSKILSFVLKKQNFNNFVDIAK